MNIADEVLKDICGLSPDGDDWPLWRKAVRTATQMSLMNILKSAEVEEVVARAIAAANYSRNYPAYVLDELVDRHWEDWRVEAAAALAAIAQAEVRS